MTTKTDNPDMVGVHVFEKANLGKAPFRCIGVREVYYQASPDSPRQVGGSCDYCGTGIVIQCQIKGADGRTFKVGSDCVHKTGDAGLIKSYKTRPEVRKAARDARARKAAKVQIEIDALMSNPAVKAGLEAQAGGRDNLYTYFQFCFRASGDSGKARWLKALKAKIALHGIQVAAVLVVATVANITPTVTVGA